MYISLSDRPKDEERPAGASRAGRGVSSVVVALGVVSMLKNVATRSVSHWAIAVLDLRSG
jgi:hypothetical protein